MASIFSLMLILTIGYAAFQTNININVKGNIKIDERCVVGNVFDFEYTNDKDKFVVPCSSIYKLETWGAQGGYTNAEVNLIGGKYAYGPGGGGGWYGGGTSEITSCGGSSYIGTQSLTDKSMYCYGCEESLDLTKLEIYCIYNW